MRPHVSTTWSSAPARAGSPRRRPIPHRPHRPIPTPLWAALLEVDPAPRVELLIDPIRRELDPAGAMIRSLGAELRRSGGLVSHPTVPEGRLWVLEREGVARLIQGGAGADELARATAIWSRIAPRARFLRDATL
jgi:hypothetical protein